MERERLRVLDSDGGDLDAVIRMESDRELERLRTGGVSLPDAGPETVSVADKDSECVWSGLHEGVHDRVEEDDSERKFDGDSLIVGVGGERERDADAAGESVGDVDIAAVELTRVEDPVDEMLSVTLVDLERVTLRWVAEGVAVGEAERVLSAGDKVSVLDLAIVCVSVTDEEVVLVRGSESEGDEVRPETVTPRENESDSDCERPGRVADAEGSFDMLFEGERVPSVRVALPDTVKDGPESEPVIVRSADSVSLTVLERVMLPREPVAESSCVNVWVRVVVSVLVSVAALLAETVGEAAVTDRLAVKLAEGLIVTELDTVISTEFEEVGVGHEAEKLVCHESDSEAVRVGSVRLLESDVACVSDLDKDLLPGEIVRETENDLVIVADGAVAERCCESVSLADAELDSDAVLETSLDAEEDSELVPDATPVGVCDRV
jgi:hypothetical protein